MKKQRHPQIHKALSAELSKLCARHGVEVPQLDVHIRDGVGYNGTFARPSAVYGEPVIHIAATDPYERVHTLRHEFVHYLDWLDGIRQEKSGWHATGFYHRLNNIEKTCYDMRSK